MIHFVFAMAAVAAAIAAPTTPAGAAPTAACAADDSAQHSVLAKLRDAQLADDGGASIPAAMAGLGSGMGADLAKAWQARNQRDWPFLCRYRADNAALRTAGNFPRVVFLGDSITENWGYADPVFFAKGFADRGIGGQLSGQIALRFYQDVVSLKPRVVHLSAGTNDLGTASLTNDAIVDNLRAMLDMAKANGIRAVLAGILPSTGSTMLHTAKDPGRIKKINLRLKQLARERAVVFVDYATAVGNLDGGLRKEFTNDGVHPNRAGYAAMRPLAERAIGQALR